MRVLPVLVSLAGAFIFMNILGCGGAARCRPVPSAGIERRAKPVPPATACEVRGDLVYNLGGGAAANSSSVAMSESSRPSRFRRYGTACEPCPPAAKPAAPIPAEPAASAAPTAFDCAARQCGESSYSRLVCESSEFMSACFTLTEEELNAGPEIYIPGVLSAEALSGAAPAAIDPPAKAVDTTEDEATDRSTAVADEPEATLEAPAAIASRPEAVEAVESKETATALTPLPTVDVYGNVMSINAVLSSIPKLKAEQAKARAEMAADGEEEMTAGIPAKLDPPVPSVTEMEIPEEQDVIAASAKAEQFPMVELPPKLD